MAEQESCESESETPIGVSRPVVSGEYFWDKELGRFIPICSKNSFSSQHRGNQFNENDYPFVYPTCCVPYPVTDMYYPWCAPTYDGCCNGSYQMPMPTLTCGSAGIGRKRRRRKKPKHKSSQKVSEETHQNINGTRDSPITETIDNSVTPTDRDPTNQTENSPSASKDSQFNSKFTQSRLSSGSK